MKIQYQSEELVVFESSLFRTTSSLVISDEYLLLVDPNWFPLELDFIETYVENLKHTGKRYLLFTHSDYDHIIGYHKFKSFQTIASQNFIDSKTKQSVLDQIIALDDDNYVKRNYEIVYPAITTPIKSDGEQLKLGSQDYVFYQARGHNKDGLITHNTSQGILIVGDYLSDIEFPYLYDSFELYTSTLNKLEKIINENDIKTLVSGHGDITHDKEEMLTRINDSRYYIRDLEKSVTDNSPFDLDALLSRYDFPQVMTKFHNKNLELLKKEIKNRN